MRSSDGQFLENAVLIFKPIRVVYLDTDGISEVLLAEHQEALQGKYFVFISKKRKDARNWWFFPKMLHVALCWNSSEILYRLKCFSLAETQAVVYVP